jgi:hypothetical protein
MRDIKKKWLPLCGVDTDVKYLGNLKPKFSNNFTLTRFLFSVLNL